MSLHTLNTSLRISLEILVQPHLLIIQFHAISPPHILPVITIHAYHNKVHILIFKHSFIHQKQINKIQLQRFSPKLEGLIQAKGLSRLGESFSPKRGSKQRTTQTLDKFSLRLSCIAQMRVTLAQARLARLGKISRRDRG